MQEQFHHQNTIYPKLDLMRTKEGLDLFEKRKKFSFLFKTILVIFVIGVIAFSLFSLKVASFSKNIFQNEKRQSSSVISQLSRLILADDKKIKGEENGRTNILLLGMGGEGHEGAFLTDTIMVVSIKHGGDQSEVALISIPRDLAVPVGGEGFYKINSVYAKAALENNLDQKKAASLTSEVISQILDLPIHYYIRVDFEGFKKIINALGGVEVDVKNSFYDPQYPTDDFGYQKISFQKGKQTLDGETALQFARSRHGIVIDGGGNEASDFARAARQQLLLEAIKEKAFSIETILNPKKASGILETFGDHVRTNLAPKDVMRLFELARSVRRDKIINKVLDDRESDLLTSSTSYGAYILIPKDGSFSEIQKFANNIFDIKSEIEEEAKIIVLNGTEIPNLAQTIAEDLQNKKFNVVFYSNAPTHDFENTVIYNKTKHANPYTLKSLRDQFSANIALDIPPEIKENPDLSNREWDLVLILGENATEAQN